MPIRDANAWADVIGIAGRCLRGEPYDPRKIRMLGMTERQMELNWKLAWLHGLQYATYEVEWDGSRCYDLEAVFTAPQNIPPGFIESGNASMPVQKSRRPIAPYQIAKRVFSQFTSMLYGDGCHPKLRVLGDPAAEDFLDGLIEISRYWSKWGEGRQLGGSIGTACVGFTFDEDGTPRLEVFNPIWCNPSFLRPRGNMRLGALEVRWQVPLSVKLRPDEPYRTKWAWRRRLIDQQSDTLFHLVWTDDEINYVSKIDGELVFPSGGREPDWSDPRLVEESTEHGFGFCPAVWVPNLPSGDGDIYGEGDIDGSHDKIREIDELNSSSTSATKHNCAATVIFEGDAAVPDGLKKGGAWAVTKGSVKYLESTGSGPKAASERAKEVEKAFLECVECVLDVSTEAGPPKTATEIVQKMGPMLRKLYRLREQYSEHGHKPLAELLLRAAKSRLQRGLPVRVPPKETIIKGEPNTYTPRDLSTSQVDNLFLRTEWPLPVKPTLADISAAVTAMTALKLQGLTTIDAAVRWLAQFFGWENPDEIIDELEGAAELAQPPMGGAEDDEDGEGGEDQPEGAEAG